MEIVIGSPLEHKKIYAQERISARNQKLAWEIEILNLPYCQWEKSLWIILLKLISKEYETNNILRMLSETKWKYI